MDTPRRNVRDTAGPEPPNAPGEHVRTNLRTGANADVTASGQDTDTLAQGQGRDVLWSRRCAPPRNDDVHHPYQCC
jgi:hypothetical protein